jgi:2-keto-4-pentenoate hydratase/2-oxohepta-3-ene-1,7-dioic acid hydratase in catechol pathway
MIKRTLMMMAVFAFATTAFAQAKQVKYVKFEANGTPAWGILENENTIQGLSGAPWLSTTKPTGRRTKVPDVKFLAPAEAKKVIAAGFNYRSHLGQASPAKYIGLFAKFPTSLSGNDAEIPYPADATSLHYEAEICVVMSKRAQNITEAQVKDHIFGVTACNDVSERTWQKQDLQWFRAKAHDGFGPMGRELVSNVDYTNLKLIGRHNGKVVQETTTDLLIFNINHIVSYVSRYVTLEPGDVVFTGTPGTTQEMKPGDTFEVEVVGVTTLRNKVAAPKSGTTSAQQ